MSAIDSDLARILAARASRQPDPGEAKPGLTENRRRMDAEGRLRPLPDGLHTQPCLADGVPCEWLYPAATRRDACLLYIHGGAFCVGSLDSHRALTAQVAQACRCPALAVDYRLAPEHKFPAALDDTLTAYRFLLRQQQPIVVVGDSAGGGLAAALLVRVRELKLPMPAGLVLLSPWLDLSASGGSFRSNAEHDPFMNRDGALFVARGYLGKTDPRHPWASPLFADLTGFPPVLLQVGSTEVLLDDSRVFAEQAQAAGVSAQLSVWPGMIHVWHGLFDELPQARQALSEIGRFVDALLSPSAV